MTPLTECEICNKKVSKINVCNICGRQVCNIHYDTIRGICEVCKLTLCEVCREYLAAGVCSICGRLVCEDCSVKEKAALICLECFKSKKSSIRIR